MPSPWLPAIGLNEKAADHNSDNWFKCRHHGCRQLEKSKSANHNVDNWWTAAIGLCILGLVNFS